MSMVPMDVQGWFHSDGLYQHIAETCPSGAVLVEVGSWLGQSTIAMARYLKARGDTSIKFHAIDTWEGTPNEDIHQQLIAGLAANGTTLYAQFMANLERYDVVDWVTPHIGTSLTIAKQFKSSSLDFVYLDADHTVDALSRDIKTWLTKLKPTGILAGDDWQAPSWDSVEQAVRATLDGYTIHVPCPYTWMVNKNKQ